MIITGKSIPNKGSRSFWLLGLILLPILFLRFFDSTFFQKSENSHKDVVICDAEEVDGEYFVTDGDRFYGAHTRSDKNKNSGDYACRLDADNNYGFTYNIEKPEPGQRYHAEVWSHNKHPVNAYLVAQAEDSDQFYVRSDNPVYRRGDYWQRWSLTFTVPRYATPDLIKVYVYKESGPNEIYFDDLKISKLEQDDLELSGAAFVPQEFAISIDEEGVNKLDQHKQRSISRGLVYHDGTKIPARIWDDNRYKKAKIRHKGDWLDHMSGVPSYRVDMSSEESWQGMQTFSVQEPNTRGFLREWVFYKFLDYADIIRPRYDFIYYKHNDDEKIVFSYEEHFGKNLVEYRARREGPIVKMTEDRIWEVTRRTIEKWKRSLPTIDEKDKAYWTSELRAFKEGKLMKNEKLLKDFNEAQNLLHQYKYQLQPASEIFDLDRMARYLALVDICLAHHAVTWHNQRFYYNPVTALLEPIGFDAYSSDDPQKYAKHIYTEKLYTKGAGHKEPIDWLFFDEEFVRAYFYYLDLYSRPEFIDHFLDDLEEDVVAREEFIRQRHATYKLDREFIRKKAAKIQIGLPAHVNSLQAFRFEKGDETQTIKLSNRHSFPIEVITGESASGEERIIYPQESKSVPVYLQWKVPSGVRSIKYKIPGIDSVYSTTVLDWLAPDDYTRRQSLVAGASIDKLTDILKKGEDGKLTMDKGDVIIDEPVIIPQGTELNILAGTNVLFKNKGCIISYSPVQITGDEEQPVVIQSDNGEAGSFSVIQASERSKIRYAIFKNQNTLREGNWQLTGAVNFYESDVDITKTRFDSNQCEDALNIIRSDFTMTECTFYKTFADAFDSDFCTGTVSNTRFVDIGNDAIDGSGSVLELTGVIIDGTGDKGISAGEQSTIKSEWTEISGCVIGVASKDKSKLHLDHLTLKDCQTGFAAYQKKPEFGPAKIFVKNYKTENVPKLYMIEEGSELVDESIQ